MSQAVYSPHSTDSGISWTKGVLFSKRCAYRLAYRCQVTIYICI
jgi:hypothetical protein